MGRMMMNYIFDSCISFHCLYRCVSMCLSPLFPNEEQRNVRQLEERKDNTEPVLRQHHTTALQSPKEVA